MPPTEIPPSLTPAVRERYERLYTGLFYDRFIKGEWAAAQGRVYDFWTRDMAAPVPEGPFERYAVSCDYGTVNPASFGLWAEKAGTWYRIEEFYYDSRREGVTRTDTEYLDDLRRLLAGRQPERVIVDPSAASFIALLQREGFPVERARNDVLSGIRRTGDLLKQGKVVVCETCGDCLREFELYRWDEGCIGDQVRKENDHAMDDLRYFCMAVPEEERGGFAAVRVRRR